MRETSLDDFIGGADGDEGEEPEARDEAGEPDIDELDTDESGSGSVIDEPDESQADDSDHDPDPNPVEPAGSTYDWTPTGADCEACGAAIEKRWRDEGRLVCADCKAW